MKKYVKVIALAAAVLCACVVLFVFSSCSASKADDWRSEGYDLSVPILGENGWYMVFEDDFDGTELNEGITFGDGYTGSKEIWTASPHAVRWNSDDESKPEQSSYWCDEMVEVKDGNAVIYSRYEDNHQCSGDCPQIGRFSSGIETRKITGDNNNNKGSNDELLFSQAFGYFECRVKLPDADGLWSAFWLQSSNQRKVAAAGVDGTEIDVYESAFRKSRQSKTGHALLWNGYGKYADSSAKQIELSQDLYNGYHTYALKWTPEYYVFYVDGEATWATMAGGVSHVEEFLRLTVEIDAGDGWGPHGQKIGQFDRNTESEFLIDYVKVWQNENYEQFIIDDACFEGSLDMDN